MPGAIPNGCNSNTNTCAAILLCFSGVRVTCSIRIFQRVAFLTKKKWLEWAMFGAGSLGAVLAVLARMNNLSRNEALTTINSKRN